MGRVTAIARHELVSNLRNRIVLLVAGMLAIALIAAVLVGWQKHQVLDSQRSDYAGVVRSQWINQPDRHPHRVSHYGQVVFRPESPLSYFDFGVNSFAGVSLYLEPHRQNVSNFSEARQTEGVLRFGELTAARVLQLIVPLFIVFVGFGCISREREDGTLAMLLCQGTSRRELLLGKTLGLMAVIGIALVPSIVLILPLLGSTLTRDSLPAVLPRLALLLVAHLLYFAILVAATVLISYSGRTSRSSLIASLGFWTVLFIVVPRSVPSIAADLYPAPSKAEFDAALDQDIREIGDSHNPADPHFMDLKNRVLKQYGVADVGALPVNWGGIVMREAEILGSSAFSRHFGNLTDTFAKQNRVSEWAGLLDPYLAMRQVSEALCNSSFADFNDFQRKAEAHRLDFVQHLNDIHSREIRFANDRAQRVESPRWQEFPAFEYSQPSVEWSLAHSLVGVLALVVWPGVLLVLMLR